MKTVSINVYSFNELSTEAKENAIEQVRQSYYEYNDFANWATDDCSLFEPKHDELISLFGENYSFPLIENTRNKIYFDTDRNSFLDCENAMIIKNEKQFLEWLGLPKEVTEDVDFSYGIFTPSYRNSSTTIDFDCFNSEFGDVIDAAIDKFNNHILDCLDRIEADIDYRFTDEAIIEEIEANDFEFLEDGTRY
jgi:hypothetical protein